MLPVSPTAVITDNSNVSLINLRRFKQRPSNATIERCCFLLIHLLFYIILFLIIYVRFEQFNKKQEKILSTLNSNDNPTFHNDFQNRLLNRNHFTHLGSKIDCSCQTYPYPKRNRTTRCLELRVGLTDTISDVFCPITNNENKHNQWLVIQNRQTNTVNFNRTWNEYRRGFGNIPNQTDFWIGNENLYWLTNNYQCRLKIELTDWHNETRTAIYELFRLSNHNDNFRIQIDGYNGNMELFKKIDSFSRWHNNAPFSTYDHYYPTNNNNCPNLHGDGGWWYHSGVDCAHVQLNGHLPTHSDGLVPLNTGILWVGWKGDRHYSFQRVQMTIQPKLKRERLHRP